MARTTPELVRGIIQVQEDVDLTPFIDTAAQLINDTCTHPTAGEDPLLFPAYTEAKMELLERWAAAHFYTIYDNQLSRAKAGTVSVGFQYKVDLGLKASMYGQQLLRLDTYGGLAALDNTANTKRKIRVSIIWLGTDPENSDFGWVLE